MTTIWFVAALSLIVDVRTDGRTFLPGLLGHLGGDDLKTRNTAVSVTAVLRVTVSCSFRNLYYLTKRLVAFDLLNCAVLGCSTCRRSTSFFRHVAPTN